MTRRKEAPLDPFKRAVTLTTRSIAADSGMEVIFTSEPPGLTGKIARLPEPSRVPTKSEIAVIRGHADAAALAVACHDPALHQSLAPPGGEAREVFEAIEQARVEAIGAKCMQGVAANLAARMEQRYERSRFAEATERSEAPLPDALSLLVREKLTGQTPPVKARAVVNLWRQWIEGRARTVLDRMPDMLFDQDAFGRLARELLAALNLADQLDQGTDEKSADERPRPTPRTPRMMIPTANGAPNFPPKAAKSRCQANSRWKTAMTAWPTSSTGPTLPSCRAARSHGAPIFRCSITPRPSATRCSPAPMMRP